MTRRAMLALLLLAIAPPAAARKRRVYVRVRKPRRAAAAPAPLDDAPRQVRTLCYDAELRACATFEQRWKAMFP